MYITCGSKQAWKRRRKGFAAIPRKALVFFLLCCLSLTAASTGFALIEPLSAMIYDILTYTQDADKGTVNGLKFNLGASGGVGPYDYSIALHQNGVEVFRTSYSSGGEKLLPFRYLGSGTYRLDLSVKDVSGYQAFTSKTVNIHNAGGRVTIFDITPATPYPDPAPEPTAPAVPDPAASSALPPLATPAVTPAPMPTPVPGKSYFYRDNTACSEGFRFRDLRPALTEKWYMFTPLDLSQDGEQIIPLIASNLFQIGLVKVSITGGNVTITYMAAEGVFVKSEFMTLFPSLDSVTEVETSGLLSSALPFGKPISVIGDLTGDTRVLLYMNLVVDYNGNEQGVVGFSSKSPAHVSFLRSLEVIMD